MERVNDIDLGKFKVWNAITGTKQETKISATFFSLVRNSELQGMLDSIKYLNERFDNAKYGYSWVFANEEPFLETFIAAVRSAFTSGTPHFVQIPTEYWSYPDFIDQDKAAKERAKLDRERVMYAKSESYRHMCRFNSGFFFELDVMQQFRYYWRVEPNIKFQCDLPTDLFQEMADGGYVYGWTMSMPEGRKTVVGLWEASKKFFEENPSYVHPNNSMQWVSSSDGSEYNMCHYWSNFELGDMEFFRSDAYREYFKALDRTGGYFYSRWGDAPVHSIAVSFLADKLKIRHFDNTGYYHKPNQGCPMDDQLRKDLHCDCEPTKEWTWHKFSCTQQFYKLSGLEIPKLEPAEEYYVD
ncbi:glycosyltransferase family 15 protein [Babjeviella inositovora NRRL Y-12698]|uniref:Glycosyltransferase family 15 protein n=1 Tax=Babjeviella inositovora NRRL Y-12698 TaxID=984486 RepID=A0A1E3QZ41_9ASCO|nr:glycosyltransferase family 15 protein [Babjeviella inositovora NRRL Y-12698]ODQ82824.1 glycosyltransferase family 15 protein [Babjeviella inositovora NRRL Y-12698]